MCFNRVPIEIVSRANFDIKFNINIFPAHYLVDNKKALKSYTICDDFFTRFMFVFRLSIMSKLIHAERRL